MIFHHQTAIYCRQRPNVFFQQRLCYQNIFSLLGDGKVWIAVRRTLLVLGPVLLAAQLLLASISFKLEQSVQMTDNVHHSLIEAQIKLLVKRDRIFSFDNVRMLAAEKLFLYAPEENQIRLL